MKISQREARRLRKRVNELESAEQERRNAWVQDWPDGVPLTTMSADASTVAQVKTARKLGYAVVVTLADCVGTLRIHALPLAKS